MCSFEGGIAGEPGFEAHGRYTFCGLATLILINEVHRLDLRSLLDWVVFRQAGLECGFKGRTNKLVDGCYSFWQGGVCSLVKRLSLDIDEQSVQPYAREGSSFDNLSIVAYSTSTIESSMHPCLMLRHTIALLFMLNTDLDVDFLESLSIWKLELVYHVMIKFLAAYTSILLREEEGEEEVWLPETISWLSVEFTLIAWLDKQQDDKQKKESFDGV
uniref:Prenyltransferase alpha-alpha toroid domain-containing protein n=1 Tax=Cucumis melo TaxID=3656 RepID=A0A9I9EHR9_CUCME